jgi:hypothetical protein
MPLRAIVLASPETLADIVLAADERYTEAEELLLLGRYDACVYLLGYAVEMWLKAACFRLRGISPSTPVKPALPALKKWLKVVVPAIVPLDYHDLSFWSECAIQLRAHAGRPMPPATIVELRDTICTGLHEEWIVEMRYRRCGLNAADAWKALEQAWWMKSNWVHLA